MSEHTIAATAHDEYNPEMDRDSDYIPLEKSPGLQQINQLSQRVQKTNLTKQTLFSDFDSVITQTKECLSSKGCDNGVIDGIWHDYSNLRNKRDILIHENESNAVFVKDLISRYDEKENQFYKIICQKIADEYHDGGGMKNCMYLHTTPVSYLYIPLVESGRSLSKFFSPASGYYSAINSCLQIKPPKQSLTGSLSRTTSQFRNYFKGETVKPFEYGGKKLTKNRLRKKGRNPTKRRKSIRRTIKRRKHTKK